MPAITLLEIAISFSTGDDLDAEHKESIVVNYTRHLPFWHIVHAVRITL